MLGKSGGILTLRTETSVLWYAKLSRLHFQEKLLSFSYMRAVPETDTGGRVEYTQALERTWVKELGKMVP